MLRRDAILASGGVLVAGSVAGCLGQSTGSASDDEATTTDSGSTEIADDATLEATLEVGDDSQRLFTTADISRVGAVSTRPQTGPSVPIELTAAGAESVTQAAAAVDLDETYEQATITIPSTTSGSISLGSTPSSQRRWRAAGGAAGSSSPLSTRPRPQRSATACLLRADPSSADYITSTMPVTNIISAIPPRTMPSRSLSSIPCVGLPTSKRHRSDETKPASIGRNG